MKLNVLTKAGLFSYKGMGRVGDVVRVNVKNNTNIGVVWSVDESGSTKGLKRAENLRITLPEDVLKLVEFSSEYYHNPLNLFINLILPGAFHKATRVYYIRVGDKPPKTKMLELWDYIKKPRTKLSIKKKFGKDLTYHLKKWERMGLVKRVENFKFPNFKPPKIYEFGNFNIPTTPTPEQMRVLNAILSAIEKGGFSPFYLWGPTGSGKTYVYLKSAERVVNSGKSVLILVPEIFLSYHLAKVFQNAFGNRFALYHSGMPEGYRLSVWKGVLDGNISVVMGTRSAVFLPFKDLGIIVVDEEFDESFKEEERVPFFNARDLGVYRAKILRIPVILGSATPSLESFHNVKMGKYKQLVLTKRIYEYENPKIEIVDLRKEKLINGVFSERFLEELNSTLENGKNAIIYINRRGYLPYFFCGDCGNPVKCENCDVVLALHKGQRGEYLKCHICGFSQEIPLTCEYCGGTNLRGVGFGTQRVEGYLREMLKVEVFRMDSDVIRKRRETLKVLKEFGEGKIRVLVGTKMVIKGLDFENVGFVGVLNADEFLYRGNDFRAEERALQYLSQVSGRIRKGGLTLIQTYNPTHRVFKALIKGNFDEVYEMLYNDRKRLGFPPFTRMAFFEVRTSSEENNDLNFKVLKDFVENYKGDVKVWGPSPPPISKLYGKYRIRLVLISEDYRKIGRLFQTLDNLKLRGKRIFNMDPLSVV